MAIDKALNQAPMGLGMLDQMPDNAEPDLEIEIEDPESVSLRMDGMEIEIEPDKESTDDFNANLAEYIDADALETLAGDLIGEIDEDISSRKDWMQTYVDGLE